VLALQALLNAAKGDDPTACDALAQAVSLGLPGGSIRLFVDLGPGLVRLLNCLDLDAEGKHYVGRILDAYRGDGKAEADEALEHSLTKRELEVLELLAKELSNKQIADQLFIAPATVKRHTENIYQKLDVPGRHQAVTKAKELTIILPA
jgi:LuxR family maltose regulon positive regulatory protein